MAGQMMVIFVMAVAAAEVAVGLGIIMAIFRLRDNIDIDELNLLARIAGETETMTVSKNAS